MPFDEGFNFRATAGFVTDPTDTQFVDSTTTYPTTANGVTFGWTGLTAGNERDRLSTVDHRLSGVHFHPNNVAGEAVFRVDLPATGDYEIHAAFGDVAAGVNNHYSQLRDNGVAFQTIDKGGTTASNPLWDATGVDRTNSAGWVANNAALSHTFTSTIFECAIGQPGTSFVGNSHVVHLQIAAAAGGTTPIDGTLSVTLDDATVAGTGTVAIAGDLGVTLDGATLSAQGENPDAVPAAIAARGGMIVNMGGMMAR